MNATDKSPDHEPLWTVGDTARYLNVTKSWVYRHTENGDIPHGKLGALIRYNPARIRQYAEQLQAEASSPNVVSLGAARRRASRNGVRR